MYTFEKMIENQLEYMVGMENNGESYKTTQDTISSILHKIYPNYTSTILLKLKNKEEIQKKWDERKAKINLGEILNGTNKN